MIEINKIKNIKKIIFVCFIIFLSVIQLSNAQYIDDGLRFTQNNAYSSARAGALGVSYYGISDDISALSFNPAGLSTSGKTELNVGFGFTRNTMKSDFLGQTNTFKSNDEILTNIGFISPFKMRTGFGAIGIGYFLESNYNNNTEFSGFNTNSSYINYEAINGPNGKYNLNNNWATYLYLADDNYKTPMKDSVFQKAFIQETGGIHDIIGGASFDVSENISLGFTIVGKWGNYKYRKQYSEYDSLNKYNKTTPMGQYYFDTVTVTSIDFNRLDMYESLDQDISGISGSFGIIYKYENLLRFGLTIKLPTYFTINETFDQTASVVFDDGSNIDPQYQSSGTTSYKVQTPFVFSLALSAHFSGLTISGALEYMDVSQIKFSDAPQRLDNLNLLIVQNLLGKTNVGIGFEYELPFAPAVVRGSVTSTSSPYQNVSGFDASVLSIGAGAGFYFAPNVRLDAMFRWSETKDIRSNYGSYSLYNYTQTPIDLGLQLTYRY